MDMTGFLTLAGFIVILVVAALIFSFWALGRVFGRSSRFDALAEYYTVNPRRGPFEKSQLWRTIKIGGVHWRKWARLVVAADGFYIGIRYGFKEHAFLIPWTALHNPKETRLYWRPAVVMEVGNPAIVDMIVYMDVYRKMGPYLEKYSDFSIVEKERNPS